MISRGVPRTEPAFFISLLSFFKSLALMLLPQQMMEKRSHFPQQTYRRYAASCCKHRKHLPVFSSSLLIVFFEINIPRYLTSDLTVMEAGMDRQKFTFINIKRQTRRSGKH
ncbi:hypothetical protein AMECASPLE_028874 [Ameca splendens]|uniref:Secreted protein n=1 Tax=Ameca splendens TaxID=208324 RepID=A0ABV1A3A1_9TELE